MTIYDVELSNRQHGKHFFEPSTKRFFRSRIGTEVYEGPGGVYFTTSEQFVGSDRIPHKRQYTVRKFNPATGDIDTVGEFQAYGSSASARRAAARLAATT
jgi:hypothetical protein